jgi:hypothetical protein
VLERERIIEDSVKAAIDMTKDPQKIGSVAGATSLMIDEISNDNEIV